MSTSKEDILKKVAATKSIFSITPFTLLDYPDNTACILWFAGCNMKCSYCYNPAIVNGKGKLSIDNALEFLKSRKRLLDGVVLSGGECTSHKSIFPLLEEVKKLGFLTKIDTNGSNPEVIKRLVERKLVDYFALDFKAPENKFRSITLSSLYLKFQETLKYLIDSPLKFEVRTTIHSNLLTVNDIEEMAQHLENHKYKGIYYLQYFRNDTKTLGNVGNSLNGYLKADFKNFGFDIKFRNAT